MFTGLISAIGEVTSINGGQITIACPYPADSIAIGASIACDGCCLTATQIETGDGPGEGQTVFHVDVSNETLARTTIGRWQPGTRINLERSLRLGDELGGHIVTGHIDGLATITKRHTDGNAQRFRLEAPPELAHFIAAKGSIALNGTSLTVNEVSGTAFTVALIPHSLAATTWGERAPGDMINLEVDLLARYVARLKAGDTAGNEIYSENSPIQHP